MKKLLIIIVLAGMILAPIGAGVAFAQEGAVGYVAGKIIGAMGWHDVITSVFADLGNIVLTIVSKVLNISGAILNASVELSIGRVGELIEKVPIVSVGWTVFRDIANLCFIFILLWIGIRTILGLGGGEIKKLLLNVIIMALLINFSLFITKAIIDAGNIATLHFYDAMRPNLIVNGVETTEKAGLSDIYMEGLRLQSVMDARGGQTTTDAMAAAGGFADNFMKVGLATILGSVFFLVTAFIFFAAAVLFIVRAVVLMFVMILAPLAFVAWVFPGMKSHTDKWWHALFSYTFFAPVYMALNYAVANAIQSGGMAELLKIQNNEASFAALMTSESSGNIGIVINYLILIVAIAATLLIAKNMGAYGGSMVMGWGQGLRKWGQGAVTGLAGGVAARTIGGFARAATNSDALKASTNPLARMALRTADRLQSMKIGGKSYKEMQEKGTFGTVGDEEVEKTMKGFRNNPAMQAQYLANLPEGQRRKAYEKLSARDRVALERTGTLSPEQITGLYNRLTPEEQDKVREARRNVERDTQNEQRLTEIEAIATPPVAGAPPITHAEMDRRVAILRPNQARELSHEARVNPDIIRRMRPQHLRDLMENGNLMPNEITAILNEITGAVAYPEQAAQLAYVSNPVNATLWV